MRFESKGPLGSHLKPRSPGRRHDGSELFRRPYSSGPRSARDIPVLRRSGNLNSLMRRIHLPDRPCREFCLEPPRLIGLFGRVFPESAEMRDIRLYLFSVAGNSAGPKPQTGGRRRRHLELVGAGRQDHAFDRRSVGIVAPARDLDVVVVDRHGVGRIEVDPAQRGSAPERHPGVRGVGAGQPASFPAAGWSGCSR